MDVAEQIQACLRRELGCLYLSCEDETSRHTGHPGVKQSGGGHYRLVVVSEKFCGLTRLARHRLVYGLLHPWMEKEIHALAIRAWTREEWEKQKVS